MHQHARWDRTFGGEIYNQKWAGYKQGELLITVMDEEDDLWSVYSINLGICFCVTQEFIYVVVFLNFEVFFFFYG